MSARPAPWAAVIALALAVETRIQPQEGAADNEGMRIQFASLVRVFRSSISSPDDAIHHTSSVDATFSQSTLAGGLVDAVGGSLVCVACDNGAGVELAGDCTVPP